MNRVVHFEIYADDTERAKKFYADIFGWTYQDWSFNGAPYFGVLTGGEGTKEPGIDATPSINKRINAVRMLVSCRHE